jgi:hypothetical protein
LTFSRAERRASWPKRRQWLDRIAGENRLTNGAKVWLLLLAKRSDVKGHEDLPVDARGFSPGPAVCFSPGRVTGFARERPVDHSSVSVAMRKSPVVAM